MPGRDLLQCLGQVLAQLGEVGDRRSPGKPEPGGTGLPFTDGKSGRIPIPSSTAGANAVGFG
jgi:hypothetical protein